MTGEVAASSRKKSLRWFILDVVRQTHKYEDDLPKIISKLWGKRKQNIRKHITSIFIWETRDRPISSLVHLPSPPKHSSIAQHQGIPNEIVHRIYTNARTQRAANSETRIGSVVLTEAALLIRGATQHLHTPYKICGPTSVPVSGRRTLVQLQHMPERTRSDMESSGPKPGKESATHLRVVF